MSLRVFHIVFIVLSIVLSLYVALWGIRVFSQDQSAGALALGVVFLCAAVGLMIYGKKTYRKLKELP